MLKNALLIQKIDYFYKIAARIVIDMREQQSEINSMPHPEERAFLRSFFGFSPEDQEKFPTREDRKRLAIEIANDIREHLALCMRNPFVQEITENSCFTKQCDYNIRALIESFSKGSREGKKQIVLRLKTFYTNNMRINDSNYKGSIDQYLIKLEEAAKARAIRAKIKDEVIAMGITSGISPAALDKTVNQIDYLKKQDKAPSEKDIKKLLFINNEGDDLVEGQCTVCGAIEDLIPSDDKKLCTQCYEDSHRAKQDAKKEMLIMRDAPSKTKQERRLEQEVERMKERLELERAESERKKSELLSSINMEESPTVNPALSKLYLKALDNCGAIQTINSTFTKGKKEIIEKILRVLSNNKGILNVPEGVQMIANHIISDEQSKMPVSKKKK